jgi:hypothetical protein
MAAPVVSQRSQRATGADFQGPDALILAYGESRRP